MATTTQLRTTPAKAPQQRRSPLQTRRMRQQAIAGTAIGAVALILTGLSLTHLSHGITIVTGAPAWESWAMAIGIDLGFVALEFANITVGERLRRTIHRWT